MNQSGSRVALVTGGSRGIGRSIALALAGVGATVAVNYRERGTEADTVVALIRRDGGHGIAVGADVSDADAVGSMISAVEAQLGPIDILVNNAGIAPRHNLDEITEADFDHTIAVNLKSAFLCSQAVLPGMRTRSWGRIINISSIAARTAQPASGISVMYNASKAALEGLTRGYAARVAQCGITVNAVAPGLIDTDMGRLMDPETIAAIPAGRAGMGEEVAEAVLMLVSNAFITGQTIAVNGGRHFL